MATKTRRLESRVDPRGERLIEEAARLTHESVSAFMVRAALTEAGRVLGRAEVTMMSNERFDELVASLDQPDEAPALARIAARPRRFTRR